MVILAGSNLQVDPRVQGARRERRVQIMAANWDPRAAGMITLSARSDGSTFIVDGQHRVAAALETQDRPARQVAGHMLPPTFKVERIYAEVFEGLTLEEEAEMYLLLNDTKIPMALDRVAVSAVAGRPDAVRVELTARKYGWFLKNTPRIQAPQTFNRIAGMDEDGVIIDRVFNILTQAWSHASDSTRSGIVEGLARLLKERPHLDDARLIKVLSKHQPSTILSNIESLRGTYQARARIMALAGLYDRGLSEARKLSV